MSKRQPWNVPEEEHSLRRQTAAVPKHKNVGSTNQKEDPCGQSLE